MQVSRGPLVLHLSSHHGDGTPGGAVLVEVTGIKELHDELHTKDYRFMNPGIEPGPVENMLSMASPGVASAEGMPTQRHECAP